MITIGEFLTSSRKKKFLSVADVEKGTRIKKEFVESLEKEEWEKLPEYPVVSGFVKSISNFLSADVEKAAAILRRDYPPKSLPLNPKPDVSKQFFWSPKLTFITGVVAIILLVFGYLGFQYYKFMSPPSLVLNLPQEGQDVSSPAKVAGKVDPDAVVVVNNQSAEVESDGSFETEIDVSENTTEVKVTATSRAGKETVVVRKVNPKI
jgi:cytoskeletal protein RodZ